MMFPRTIQTSSSRTSSSGSSAPAAPVPAPATFTPSRIPGGTFIPGETRATRSARSTQLSLQAHTARIDLTPRALTSARSSQLSLHAHTARVDLAPRALTTLTVNLPTFTLPPNTTRHPVHGFRPVNSTTSAGFHSPAFGAFVECTSRLALEQNRARQRLVIEPWLSRRAWTRKAAELTVQKGLPPGADLGWFEEAVKVVPDDGEEEKGEHRIAIKKAPDGFQPRTGPGPSIVARGRGFDSFYYRNRAGNVMLVLDSRREGLSRVEIGLLNWIVEYVRTHSWEVLIRDQWDDVCVALWRERNVDMSVREMRGKWSFFWDWVVRWRGRVYAGRFVQRAEGM
ncbi:uncharacterized protein H6S33_001964 [Morchella sextelata]|uniref:uncharacterized protein n=1 Tax=Morchella sextelata TaxID=1174677 RepID=UPI001D04FD20|nr:uncharacterized protein H6S33_001964 [Morchella sextelata]KAH0607912.1 hypothetical protein H6S33_001964 [Morchella sextelata]